MIFSSNDIIGIILNGEYKQNCEKMLISPKNLKLKYQEGGSRLFWLALMPLIQSLCKKSCSINKYQSFCVPNFSFVLSRIKSGKKYKVAPF